MFGARIFRLLATTEHNFSPNSCINLCWQLNAMMWFVNSIFCPVLVETGFALLLSTINMKMKNSVYPGSYVCHSSLDPPFQRVFQTTPIWTIGTCLDPTFATYETHIKYSNLRFIQPSLTKPYTGPRVSFFLHFFHSEACIKWWQASRRLWRVRWRLALERRDPTDLHPNVRPNVWAATLFLVRETDLGTEALDNFKDMGTPFYFREKILLFFCT